MEVQAGFIQPGNQAQGYLRFNFTDTHTCQAFVLTEAELPSAGSIDCATVASTALPLKLSHASCSTSEGQLKNLFAAWHTRGRGL